MTITLPSTLRVVLTHGEGDQRAILVKLIQQWHRLLLKVPKMRGQRTLNMN